jgi:hypothetical protein
MQFAYSINPLALLLAVDFGNDLVSHFGFTPD